MNSTKSFSSLSAPDIKAVKQFYGEILGLAVKDSMGGIDVTLPGGLPLFIYPAPHQAPNYTVLNFLVDDIEKAVDELMAKGVVIEQYPDLHTDAKGISHTPEGQPGPKAIAWFKDPAGHILAVIQEK